jgi:hypothetical protein
LGALSLILAAGCEGQSGKVDVPNPERVERKDWKDMSQQEKITFIEKTPQSEEAKKKEIERIKAGQY